MRILLVLMVLISCSKKVETYTLYRNSIVIDNARIHMATFDSNDEAPYNQENCELARTLFQSQPQVVTHFWCEKGHYQK